MPDRTETTKGRDESPYRQDPTASRTGSSPDRVRDGKRVEHTAPSPNSQTTAKPVTLEEWEAKGKQLLALLLECRDALPAINTVSARLHNVRLDLADRIEAAMEPWRLP